VGVTLQGKRRRNFDYLVDSGSGVKDLMIWELTHKALSGHSGTVASVVLSSAVHFALFGS